MGGGRGGTEAAPSEGRSPAVCGGGECTGGGSLQGRAEAVVPRACRRGARTTRTGGAHPPTASDPGAALELRIGGRDWSGKWPDGGHGDGDGRPAGWGP